MIIVRQLKLTDNIIKNNNNNKYILLVDDESVFPYTIKNILEDNGFAVDTFNDLILTLNCTMRNLEKLYWHLVKQ
jgi:ActR/RegA family two-component response regulator